MHSVISLSLLLASFTAFSAAQSIDPNSVPLSTRDIWCNSQITECPLICLQTPGNSAGTDANSCDPTTLSYNCVCSNGISPNASEYSQTLPYFICTQYNSNCVTACGSDNTCAAACNQDHPCGAQNPTRVNTSTISTMASTSTSAGIAVSTASDGAVYTGFGGAAASTTAAGSSSTDTTNKSGAADVVVNLRQVYGMGVVLASLFAGFTLCL